MDNSRRIICLGVSGADDIYLFSRANFTPGVRFRIDKSSDGLNFEKLCNTNLTLKNPQKQFIFQDLRLTKIDSNFVLTYKVLKNGKSHVSVCKSKDLVVWDKLTKLETLHDPGIVVALDNNEFGMVTGGKSIKILRSKDLKKWTDLEIILEIPQDDMRHHAIVGDTKKMDEGVLVTYFLSNNPHNTTSYSVMAMLFDSNLKEPLWKEPVKIMHPEGHKIPIGVVIHEGSIKSYWQRWNGELLMISHGSFKDLLNKKTQSYDLSLKRHHQNPLINPNPRHDWQSEAVFNPGAVYDQGKVHLIYRAVGSSNVSSWGHAKSIDGVHFEPGKKPIYTPKMHFEKDISPNNKNYKYISGPGWGGCEDPRAVIIDDNLYVIYIAFDGNGPQRVAVTSLGMGDFRNEEWNWSKPCLVSPPGIPNKNWVLFPEKIDGKFAMLHSITPKISIDYFDSFENLGHIQSIFTQTNRYDYWDNWVRGVGPPPVKTDFGWLVFYHAMDMNDPGKYKLGALLLDKDNPDRIIARSRVPVLEPQTHYENNGLKHGVVFATGALVIDGILHLYYGSSDHTISLACVEIDRFVYNLVNHTKMKRKNITNRIYND